jgi:hypothetical protein
MKMSKNKNKAIIEDGFNGYKPSRKVVEKVKKYLSEQESKHNK